jgi:hypothetical protein
MLKFVSRFIPLALFIFSLSAVAQTRKEVSDALSKAFSRDAIPLSTVAGIKPFSIAVPGDGPYFSVERNREIFEFSELIRRAQSKKIISNENIEAFFTDIFGVHDQEDKSFGITWVNRKAAERVLRDKSVIKVLSAHQIPIPKDVSALIELYRRAVQHGGFIYTGPKWANVVIGICLGFPPYEVALYAKRNSDPNDLKLPNKGVVVVSETGDQLMSYARFTDLEKDRDEYYLKAAPAAFSQLLAEKNRGTDWVQIVNRPDLILKDIPEFPSHYLLSNNEWVITSSKIWCMSPLLKAAM